MSDEENDKPRWVEVELDPYANLTEKLKEVRAKVVKLRDALQQELENKEDS